MRGGLPERKGARLLSEGRSDEERGGSIPPPTARVYVAQSVERRLARAWTAGSLPLIHSSAGVLPASARGGVVQRQNASLPSWSWEFESPHPLWAGSSVG